MDPDLLSLNVLVFPQDQSISLVLAHYFHNSFLVIKYTENRLPGKGQVVFFRNTVKYLAEVISITAVRHMSHAGTKGRLPANRHCLVKSLRTQSFVLQLKSQLLGCLRGWIPESKMPLMSMISSQSSEQF